MTRTQDSTGTSTDTDDSVILVVDPDDIISAMRRNARNAHTRRTHKLRFNRPLEGRVTDNTHVHEEGTYWPNPKTAPLTLNPEQFIENHINYDVSDDVEATIRDISKEALYDAVADHRDRQTPHLDYAAEVTLTD